MLKDALKVFDDVTALYLPQKIPRLWLPSRTIRTAGGLTNYLKAGDKINVNMWGQLVDVTEDGPTHEIVACWAALHPPYKIEVRNLKTDLITEIELQ